MPSDDESGKVSQINTSGGTAIGGDVNTGGGDFVGHDKIIHGDEVRGDKVAGDKIVHNYYTAAPDHLTEPASPLLAAEIAHQSFEPETILIPAGPFVMGNDAVPSEAPRQTVDLPAYRIGKTPITNRQYAAFLQHNPAQPEPDRKNWFLRKPKPGMLDHPVVNVSWHEACAYCAWLSRATGRTYQLPSEAEWEKAARGADGRRYPWGNQWRDGYANVAGATTTGVDRFSAGASPAGCLDLLGNVQEWTSSPWGESDPPTAYVLRGGSFRSQPSEVRCSARDGIHPTSKVAWRGFRVVLSVS